MFKEKVNARTDGRTTDNGPWHKLAGLRSVELKKVVFCEWLEDKQKSKDIVLFTRCLLLLLLLKNLSTKRIWS